MKKKQIITGVVAATLVGSVNLSFAQEKNATNQPDFYGKLFLMNEQRSDTPDTDSDGNYLNSNASRIGVKGKYKTDVKGLDVIYKIEMQVDVDNDADELLKARNQFVGLKHKQAGSLIAGNHDTALKLAQAKVDLFNDYNLGDFKNSFYGEQRKNTVMYTSPRLKGVQLRVATHSDADATNANSASLSYEYKKNIYVAVATDKNVDDKDSTRLVAQYKAKQFSLGLVHQTSEAANDAEAQTASLLNASYNLNKKTQLKLQLSNTEQKTIIEDATDANLVTAGVDYKLSKKSKAVAYYTAKSNNYLASYTGDKSKESILGVGLVHKF